MRLLPKCGVYYKGERYPGGVAFEIDPADRDALSALGEIIDEASSAKKPGRPRKAVQSIDDIGAPERKTRGGE